MKRTIALGAAWTASAAAAVGLGFLAVSLVDASASPATQPVAATTTSSTTTTSPTTAPTGPASPATVEVAPSTTDQYETAAGSVIADCASGSPVLAGVPAAGWFVDDSNDVGELEFKAGDQRVEVSVSCVDGAPQFRLDDSSPSATSPTPTGADDSDGRGGGGHGSDD